MMFSTLAVPTKARTPDFQPFMKFSTVSVGDTPRLNPCGQGFIAATSMSSTSNLWQSQTPTMVLHPTVPILEAEIIQNANVIQLLICAVAV